MYYVSSTWLFNSALLTLLEQIPNLKFIHSITSQTQRQVQYKSVCVWVSRYIKWNLKTIQHQYERSSRKIGTKVHTCTLYIHPSSQSMAPLCRVYCAQAVHADHNNTIPTGTILLIRKLDIFYHQHTFIILKVK